MSEDIRYLGKAIPTGKTVEEYAGSRHEFEYNDDYYNKAVEVEGMVYELEMKAAEIDNDWYKASKNEDGTISFDLKFYNGVCNVEEALEIAIRNCKLVIE